MREGDRHLDRTASLQRGEGSVRPHTASGSRCPRCPLPGSATMTPGWCQPPPQGRRLGGLKGQVAGRGGKRQACVSCHFPFWAFALVLWIHSPSLLKSTPSLPGAGEHEKSNPICPAEASRASIPLSPPPPHQSGSWCG